MKGYPNLRLQNERVSVYVYIVAAISVPDRRLYNVTSVHSGSTDYATLLRPFYLILLLLYII